MQGQLLGQSLGQAGRGRAVDRVQRAAELAQRRPGPGPNEAARDTRATEPERFGRRLRLARIALAAQAGQPSAEPARVGGSRRAEGAKGPSFFRPRSRPRVSVRGSV